MLFRTLLLSLYKCLADNENIEASKVVDCSRLVRYRCDVGKLADEIAKLRGGRRSPSPICNGNLLACNF